MSRYIKFDDAVKVMACEMYAEAQSQGYDVDGIEDFMPEAKAWLNDAPSIDIEPNSSEIPNNSTISKMEQVDEPQTPYDNCQSCLHWVYDGYWYCECNECRYEPKDEPQTYITEDRDTQILDAWQVHHRSTTSVEDEPQTDCPWR